MLPPLAIEDTTWAGYMSSQAHVPCPGIAGLATWECASLSVPIPLFMDLLFINLSYALWTC